jgi:hypothetical protein
MKKKTFNVQRLTFNVQWNGVREDEGRHGAKRQTPNLGNHGEVEAAESRKDFVHKLRICLKELEKTWRWLRLLQRAGFVITTKMASILNVTEELIRIFSANIRTAEKSSK